MIEKIRQGIIAFFTPFFEAVNPALEAILNVVFVPTKRGGEVRGYVRDILFFALIGWIVGSHWDIVSYTGFHKVWMEFSNDGVAKRILAILIGPLPHYAMRVMTVFFFRDSLMLWLPILSAYYFAFHVAARYVEDVYEVSDALKSTKEGMQVVREWLARIAFGRNYGDPKRHGKRHCWWRNGPFRWITCPAEVLRIVHGEVQNRLAPLLLIGGPGYVFVGGDTAVVFERPDGTPHVIGPTPKEAELLGGFERIRRIVDLREHRVTLSMKARSRDGLPIEIQDVQLLFSVYRGDKEPTEEEPFPFVPEALEKLVYGESATVVKDRWEALSSSRLVTTTMRVMASSELRKFIQSQTVVEFLASVTPADVAELQEGYEDVQQAMEPEDDGVEPHPPKPFFPKPPKFARRSDIAERFSAMSNGPRGENAKSRGVGLQWIGLGAWHTPVTKIIDQHLDAWRLSLANLARSNAVVLHQLERQGYLTAFTKYVREMLAQMGAEGLSDAERERRLLRYFADRLETAALTRYGGMAHAPASWRQAWNQLRNLFPRDVDVEDPNPGEPRLS